jgi:glucose 1-dehydrogenase/3-oxoacyl-[acyl-carrier protein] reductase
MLEQGQGGSIINITSVHGCSGYPGFSVYAGTKGAIWAWTRQLAVELAPLGIRVNGVAPGWIVVARNYQEIPGLDPEAIGERMIPYKRLGKPVDIARTCAFLASDDADYMVGQVVIVDGGVRAKTSLPLETLDSILGDAG